jgi:two-component system LytT family response regulator
MNTATRVRALIVDDEPLARERLKALLAGDPEIDLIGDCANGRDAIEEISVLSPDLVFLDIEMPEIDGFQVLESVAPEQMPLVVFVTAHGHHAVRAFEVHALDYLLKPYDRERFARTLQRAKERLVADARDATADRTQAMLSELNPHTRSRERLLIKVNDRMRLLRAEAIDWIEAEGKYVRVHAGGETYLLREAIGELSVQLDPRQFVRIHRSTIVNIDRIVELEPWFQGEYRVVLKDGTRLTLSRSCRKRLSALLGGSL